ncbi:MAG: hypothetical protein H6791_01060 [Candidatus Nomurabacteria bacterium]|nr:MAG: hypothetical protein H6791_01060 [Candidatus Nomurabacteria bacterium]
MSKDFFPGFMSDYSQLEKVLIILVFCYTWKVGGNIYSIWGGYNPDGSVYSLFPIFQDAGVYAFGLFGLALYQNAGKVSSQKIGFCFLQKEKIPSDHNQKLIEARFFTFSFVYFSYSLISFCYLSTEDQ